MFRAAPRLIARPASLRATVPRPATRYLSTTPRTQKSRSWKSLVARLGVAGAIIYYYNTNDIFMEEPRHSVHALPIPESDLPTIESIAAEREKRRAVQVQLDAQRQKEEEAAKTQNATAAAPTDKSERGLEGLEEEAGQQGAFNPETGEINWDCPCLGGMADGPCGDEFKAAFSCFVFSEEEPKGMDCIDKFKNMQNCFRQYPEIYGSELESDADDGEDDELSVDVDTPSEFPSSSATETEQSKSTSTERPQNTEPFSKPPSESPSSSATETEQSKSISTKRPQTTEPSSKPPSPDKVAEKRPELGLVPENYRPKEEVVSESETLAPKAAHDATDANTEEEEKKSKASEKK